MVTTVSAVNQCFSTYVETVATGGLDPSAYTIYNQQLSPHMLPTGAAILEMNRNHGVKDGQTYYFTSSFLFGGVTCSVQFQLTGTFASSNLSANISVTTGADVESSGWFSDYDTHSLTVAIDLANGQVVNLLFSAQFVSSALGYDDFAITFQPSDQAPQRWAFGVTIPPAQQKDLLTPRHFATIATQILQGITNPAYSVATGGNPPVKGCFRPEWVFDIDPDLFFYFYNSPFGYRGQYASSPKQGAAFNHLLVNALGPPLVAATSTQIATSPLDVDQIYRSLAYYQSKIWPLETQFAPIFNDPNYTVDILEPTWIRNLGVSVNNQPKAKWGVRVVAGTTLQVKGGWLDPVTFQPVEEPTKVNRSEQIQLYGFS